jgi:ferric-dicitrate binding protein FerR (iron transport regulator)
MEPFIEEIIFSCLQGKATREEEDLLRAWIDESEAHREEHERFLAGYYRLNYAGAWHEIDECRARRRVFKKRDERRRRRAWLLPGAAAAVMLAAWLAWPAARQDPEAEPAGLSLGGARVATLVLDDGTRVKLAAGCVVEAGHARAEDEEEAGLTYRQVEPAPGRVEYNTLVVPRGGIYRMTLADGTRAWLNAGSSARYPVTFEGETREIFVEGEVFLEVARDAARPFIVHAGATATRVTGTTFNVMAYPGDRAVEVTLASGRVTVEAGGRALELEPGQQARVDGESLEATRREVDVERYTSWMAGMFDFEGMGLEELCERLGRWYDVEFEFVSSGARARRFTGAVKRDNNLQFMLDFIMKTSSVRFVARGRVIEVHDR